MIRSPLVRSLLASAAIVAAIALAGCQTDLATLPTSGKAMAPLSDKMVADIEKLNMDKDSPILIRAFKQESELEVWKMDRGGRFALLKTYPICRWSGELGPKVKEGDRQAPEGFYNITPGQMNPNSAYYLSFDLGYPNAYDRSHGRTGSQLMVHGDCSSRGCYSMTDEQIAEIYALGREAFFGGQKSFQVQAYPFRMTAQNLAKHRNNPHMAFWKMLKQGNDHFEVSRLEPRVSVCEKRYVFDAQDPNDPSRPLSFSAANKCPVFEVPQDIATAVQDKQRRDEVQTADLIGRGTPVAPVKTYADGGMHPVFVNALKGGQPTGFQLASVPGTIPSTVRPPRIPELEGTPVMTGSTPVSTPAMSTPVRVATAEPGAVIEREVPAPALTNSTSSLSSSNFFGSLFSADSKKAPESKKSSDGPIDKMAKFMGLRSSDPAPAATEPAPAAKPRAVARTAPTTAPGAIRPRPVEAAQAPAPQAPAARTAEAPAPAPAVAPTASMAGAAPTVPAGSFDSRWSAFR